MNQHVEIFNIVICEIYIWISEWSWLIFHWKIPRRSNKIIVNKSAGMNQIRISNANDMYFKFERKLKLVTSYYFLRNYRLENWKSTTVPISILQWSTNVSILNAFAVNYKMLLRCCVSFDKGKFLKETVLFSSKPAYNWICHFYYFLSLHGHNRINSSYA